MQHVSYVQKKQKNTDNNNQVMFSPTIVGGTRTPTPPAPESSRESPTSTSVVKTTPTFISTTTTARNTSNFSPTPSGPQNFSKNPINTHPVGKLSKMQNKVEKKNDQADQLKEKN